MDASWPTPLAIGDRVVLLTPSSPAADSGVAAAETILASWGLAVEIAVTPPDPAGPPYLAGSDRSRCEALRRALDPACDVRAVICARGGYGAMRLLDLHPRWADESVVSRWLVGSSDATALHLALDGRGFRGSVYGPMPATDAFADNAELTRRLLFGELVQHELSGRVVIPGEAEAPLTGGCLSLVSALIGSRAQLRAEGRIVLLEDVGERPYRLDRMLTSLRLAGCLRGAVGIAVGSLHDCGLTEAEADALLRDRLGDLGVPVVAGLPFGHGPRQSPLALHGPAAVLRAPSQGRAATLSQRMPGG